MSGENDVLDGISDKANHLLQQALRRSARIRQTQEQALASAVLQVAYMLGLEASCVGEEPGPAADHLPFTSGSQ